MALGWGPSLGFSSQLCPDRSSLSTGLGRGQALPTLLAVMLCDAGVGSRAEGRNPHRYRPYVPEEQPTPGEATQPALTASPSPPPPAEGRDSST